MSEGDILHLLFEGESGVAITYTLNSIDPVTGEDNIEDIPGTPVALPASDITSNSFTANWNFMENTLGFYLDVAKDSAFTIFVAGYNGLDVGLVNEYPVVGIVSDATYYYRLRGYNDYGTDVTANSNVITTTTTSAVIIDGDGNIYTFVTIGLQQWLVENLHTTKYIDGAAIPNVIGNAAWSAMGTDAYCWYNDDFATYGTTYGALYNHYAAIDAHGIAPAGWRLPILADIATLGTFLGGNAVAGGKLKEIGLTHWNTPNTGATDEVGFTALPSGGRYTGGVSAAVTESVSFWCSDFIGGNPAVYTLYDHNATLGMGVALGHPEFGNCIRCMRDV